MALPLAWFALFAFLFRSGLPSAQAFTRIMKRLHLCVYLVSFFSTAADTTWVSIGAGSVLSTRTFALGVYSSGCGPHYSLRQCYTSHCISGWKVAYLSMKRAGTGFAFRTPIRGLNTRSGKLHWECFCKPSPRHPSIVKVAHRSLNHQSSSCIFPHRRSSLHTTIFAIQ